MSGHMLYTKYKASEKEGGYVTYPSYPAKSANSHGPVVTLTTAAILETQVTFIAFSSQRASHELLGTPHHLKPAPLQLLTCFPLMIFQHHNEAQFASD